MLVLVLIVAETMEKQHTEEYVSKLQEPVVSKVK